MSKSTVRNFLTGMSAMGFAAFAFPAVTSADSLSDLTTTCAGCHGEKGVPTDKSIPIIWGQNRAYLLNQLYNFKVGHRQNEIMSGMAAGLTKSDTEELATYFSKQPWPDLQQAAPSGDELTDAKDVINRINCRGCHQDNFEGDTTRPRLAGQQADYLLKTMTDFRKGDRKTYIGMTALLNAVHETALKPVADYLASLQVAPTK
jgi:cytochrome c553